jgi:hypothetical protein
LYASIQAEAISRSAVFQIQWAGAYELVELSLEAHLSHRCGVRHARVETEDGVQKVLQKESQPGSESN